MTQKGHAGSAGKTDLETVGPLKQDNMRHLSSKTVTRTRPGVPSGTVADIYIYIYIYVIESFPYVGGIASGGSFF